MVLSKDAFKKIVMEFPVLLVSEDDPAEALNFAAAVLKAETDALIEKCPAATRTIDRLESALHEVYELAFDAANEYFSEGE